MGEGYDQIYVLDRFLWLQVEAKPEEHQNWSKIQTNNNNIKIGLEATGKLQAIKNGKLIREVGQ